MFNSFFSYFVIRQSILKKAYLLLDDKDIYIKDINLFIDNGFISNNIKNYLIKIKEKLSDISE